MTSLKLCPTPLPTTPVLRAIATSDRTPVVLIAGVEPETHEAAANHFAEIGVTVRAARDGEEALSLFRGLDPDLVLLSSSPEQDSRGVCSALRALPTGREVPILMLVPSDDETLIDRALCVGVTDVVGGPVNWPGLVRRVSHFVGVGRRLRDVQQERDVMVTRMANAARREAEALAGHDPLTGLPNGVEFKRLLSTALARRRRKGGMVAVLLLDIHRFKEINETCGRAAGDEILRQIATRIRDSLRTTDSVGRDDAPAPPVARLSGDEFLVLLDDVSDAGAVARITQRILDSMTTVFSIADRDLYLSASVGIAVAPSDSEEDDCLVQHAETATHHAKRKGRQTYRFFAESMNAAVVKKLELETQLRRALARGEFFLCYQPVVDGQTQSIVGVEALLRWNHPQRGTIGPEEFVPVAEETGIMVSLGEWVLRTACQQVRAWIDAGHPPLRVAVNLSSCQLEEGDLRATVRNALDDAGLPARLLELELTERRIMGDGPEILSRLNELRAMGVRLSVDDFGTGHSALAYLKKFPLDVLKIDRSFVEGINVNADDTAIIQAMIAMAHCLHLKVIAEGVETPEQRSFLLNHQCDELQGFLFGRPMGADELPLLLAGVDMNDQVWGEKPGSVQGARAFPGPSGLRMETAFAAG